MTLSLQFTTADETATDRIGYHFGEVFYAPLLKQNLENESLVVAAYGPMGTGKTPFSTAFLNRDETYFNEYTALLQNRVIAPLDKGEIRYNDFGRCRVGRSNWRLRMQGDGGLHPKAQTENPVGIDLLEHVPIPHLLKADIVLLAAQSGAALYYKKLGHFFKKTALDYKSPLSPRGNNDGAFLGKMASICFSFAAHRKKLDSSQKANHRSFKILLLNGEERITDRFRNFQPTRMKMTPIPPRHHPNIGQFVVMAGMV